MSEETYEQFIKQWKERSRQIWFIDSLLMYHVKHGKEGETGGPGNFLESLHLVQLPYYRTDVIDTVECNKTVGTHSAFNYNLTVRTKDPTIDAGIWDDLMTKLGIDVTCPKVPVRSPQDGIYMWISLIEEKDWKHLLFEQTIVQMTDQMEAMNTQYAGF